MMRVVLVDDGDSDDEDEDNEDQDNGTSSDGYDDDDDPDDDIGGDVDEDGGMVMMIILYDVQIILCISIQLHNTGNYMVSVANGGWHFLDINKQTCLSKVVL